jgi:hypothetical protein
MLMRTCIAVMEEAQQALLQLDDFESIITHLKVRGCWAAGLCSFAPLRW